MPVLSSTNGCGHSKVNSWLWGELDFMLTSSVIQGCAGAHMRFITLHQFLKSYTQVIFFYRVPGLPILSLCLWNAFRASLPENSASFSAYKVACLSPGPRGWSGDNDVVPDVMGETRQGLAPIPTPYLHEQVVLLSSASWWYWYPHPYHPFILEQQHKTWE